jgi:hypothetical protein
LEDYTNINDGPVSIFKPHGSWNWGWEFPNLEPKSFTTPQWLFQERVNLNKLYYELSGDYENMIDWNSYGMQSGLNENRFGKYNVNKSNLSLIPAGNENLYFPSLLLPYRDKDEFTMPSSHFWDLKNYLAYVESLIIVGWKANEKYFNSILKSECKKIKKAIIVDPYPEHAIDSLQFFTDRNVEIIKYVGFEEFVLKGFDVEFS